MTAKGDIENETCFYVSNGVYCATFEQWEVE